MILFSSFWLNLLNRHVLNRSLYTADRHWKLVWRRHSSKHSLNERPVISEWNSPLSRLLRYLWKAVSGRRPLMPSNKWDVTELSGYSVPLSVQTWVWFFFKYLLLNYELLTIIKTNEIIEMMIIGTDCDVIFLWNWIFF